MASRFTNSSRLPRRHACVTIEYRLDRLTDATLCVRTGVAVEAIRRRLAVLERVRVVGVLMSSACATGPAAADTLQQARTGRLALGMPAGPPRCAD
jgi:hypothetical protein